MYVCVRGSFVLKLVKDDGHGANIQLSGLKR